jgi:hypothetical protein
MFFCFETVILQNNCFVTGAKAPTPPGSENLEHNSEFEPENDEDDLSEIDDNDVSRSQNYEPPSHKTMKTLDRAARMAMLPECEIYCVDLKEGI